MFKVLNVKSAMARDVRVEEVAVLWRWQRTKLLLGELTVDIDLADARRQQAHGDLAHRDVCEQDGACMSGCEQE